MSNAPETRPFLKRDVVALLRSFARQLQAMDDADVARLIAGDRFEIRLLERSRRRSQSSPSCSEDELDRLRRNLLKAKSREVARELIDRSLHSKADLFALARELDVSVPKSATSENLRERLVEGTVGFRVRAAAVRGVTADSPDPSSS